MQKIPEDIATRNGRTHIQNTALPLSKFSCRSTRYVIGQKNSFTYTGLPWGSTVPCYTFLESKMAEMLTAVFRCWLFLYCRCLCFDQCYLLFTHAYSINV